MGKGFCVFLLPITFNEEMHASLIFNRFRLISCTAHLHAEVSLCSARETVLAMSNRMLTLTVLSEKIDPRMYCTFLNKTLHITLIDQTNNKEVQHGKQTISLKRFCTNVVLQQMRKPVSKNKYHLTAITSYYQKSRIFMYLSITWPVFLEVGFT